MRAPVLHRISCSGPAILGAVLISTSVLSGQEPQGPAADSTSAVPQHSLLMLPALALGVAVGATVPSAVLFLDVEDQTSETVWPRAMTVQLIGGGGWSKLGGSGLDHSGVDGRLEVRHAAERFLIEGRVGMHRHITRYPHVALRAGPLWRPRPSRAGGVTLGVAISEGRRPELEVAFPMVIRGQGATALVEAAYRVMGDTVGWIWRLEGAGHVGGSLYPMFGVVLQERSGMGEDRMGFELGLGWWL